MSADRQHHAGLGMDENAGKARRSGRQFPGRLGVDRPAPLKVTRLVAAAEEGEHRHRHRHRHVHGGADAPAEPRGGDAVDYQCREGIRSELGQDAHSASEGRRVAGRLGRHDAEHATVVKLLDVEVLTVGVLDVAEIGQVFHTPILALMKSQF
ncbi:hypothetical protein [Cryobacterium sp. TMT2-42-4]|uniref:hypothetical protein n=1 Tax=Cryobacterium sp. TMT2-42-4 TaxID=1259255 RepID=UPI001F53E8DF|nr:hypothetical protein [Cryobacterium sp. TMT2-42-4]